MSPTSLAVSLLPCSYVHYFSALEDINSVFFVLETGRRKYDEKAGWRKLECDLRDILWVCVCVCWEGGKKLNEDQ